MVSKQNKKQQHQSVPLSSQEAVKKKKIKKKDVKDKKTEAKIPPKSKGGQIKHVQSKKNPKQDFSVKHSMKVGERGINI